MYCFSLYLAGTEALALAADGAMDAEDGAGAALADEDPPQAVRQTSRMEHNRSDKTLVDTVFMQIPSIISFLSP
jgi:hypothetical protein